MNFQLTLLAYWHMLQLRKFLFEIQTPYIPNRNKLKWSRSKDKYCRTTFLNYVQLCWTLYIRRKECRIDIFFCFGVFTSWVDMKIQRWNEDMEIFTNIFIRSFNHPRNWSVHIFSYELTEPEKWRQQTLEYYLILYFLSVYVSLDLWQVGGCYKRNETLSLPYAVY